MLGIKPNVSTHKKDINLCTAQPWGSLEPHFSPHPSYLCNLCPNPKYLFLIYLWVCLPVFFLPKLYLQSLLKSHSFPRSPASLGRSWYCLPSLIPYSEVWGSSSPCLLPYHPVLCSTRTLNTVTAYWYLELDAFTYYFNLRVWHIVSAKWIQYRSPSANSIPRPIWIDGLFSSFPSIMPHFHLYLQRTQAAAILSGL